MKSALLRRAVLAPAAVLFSILVAHALLETARDALFLARLGPDRLAWAYIAMASAALLAVAAVRRRGGGRDPRRMLLAFLLLAVAGTAVLAVTIATARSAVFVLYVWTGLVATLVVPAFWTVVDRSLRVAEAKQVFGAIGAGGVLGALVGSAIAGALGRVVAAQYLVTAGGIAFAAAAITAFVLTPRVGAAEPAARRRRAEVLSQKSRRYVRLLIVVELLSMIALTFGDLMFKRIVADRLAAGDLASAFGAIYTGLNLVGLAIQLFVTPRLLARWGVGNAMTVLPVLLVATALGFSMTGALIAVLALKLGDGGLRHSLNRVSSEILFLPVPAIVRDGWKPVADAVGQRGGQALAALAVFGLGALGGGGRVLGVVTAAMAAGWLVAIAITRRAYVAQFRETLKAGEIQRDVRVPELDADSRELLIEALSSPDEVEALAALDLLARRGRVPALVLYHPRAVVVQHALSLLEGELRPDVVRVLGHLLALLEGPHVRGDVRRVFLSLGQRGLDHLIAALDDPRTPLGVRRHLPRTISRFETEVAAAALVARLLREPDGTTEYKLLRAIGRMRADEPELAIDTGAIRSYARRAGADAARYATFADQLDAAGLGSPGAALIRELLVEKRWWAFERAFRALGILAPRAGLRSIHDAIRGTNDARHSAAREIAEAVVPAELRVPLFAALDGVPPEVRRVQLGDLAPGPFDTYEAFLAALLTDPSESLRCVVAYHAAEHRLIGLRGALVRLRPLVEPRMVAHAFDQAIARLDG